MTKINMLLSCFYSADLTRKQLYLSDIAHYYYSIGYLFIVYRPLCEECQANTQCRTATPQSQFSRTTPRLL